MHQRQSNTAHSNTQFEIVRIIRPHHPLFGKTFPLVRRWKHKKNRFYIIQFPDKSKHKKNRFYIIQFPDKSHIQIPTDWADDGKTPLPNSMATQPVFTVISIKRLILLITTLKKRGSTN
jgi:hypothetical protein